MYWHHSMEHNITLRIRSHRTRAKTTSDFTSKNIFYSPDLIFDIAFVAFRFSFKVT